MEEANASADEHSLTGQLDLCHGGHDHLVLRGRSKRRGASWTSLSEDFPKRARELLAWRSRAGSRSFGHEVV